MTNRNLIFGIENDELMDEAVQERLPVKITQKKGNRWYVYKSNFIANQNDLLILALPMSDMGDIFLKSDWGQEISVTFDIGYHKCQFSTRIINQGQHELEPGFTVRTITILAPRQLAKIQRRTFDRVLVPPGEIILVDFCAFRNLRIRSQVIGRKWQGILYDLSMRGLGVTVATNELPYLKLDEQFRVSFVPLPQQEPLLFRVRFRHATEMSETDRFLLGFQIADLEISKNGLEILHRIEGVVNTFQHMCEFTPQVTSED